MPLTLSGEFNKVSFLQLIHTMADKNGVMGRDGKQYLRIFIMCNCFTFTPYFCKDNRSWSAIIQNRKLKFKLYPCLRCNETGV